MPPVIVFSVLIAAVSTGIGTGMTFTGHSVLIQVLAWGSVIAVGFLIWRTGTAKVYEKNADAQKFRAEEAERKYEKCTEELKDVSAKLLVATKQVERLSALENIQKLVEFMADERRKTEAAWQERITGVLTVVQQMHKDNISSGERKHAEVIEYLRANRMRLESLEAEVANGEHAKHPNVEGE